MKSRTSFFNAAVLRKDITRFAPVWGLYLTGMLLLCLSIFTEAGYDLASAMGASIGLFSPLNICYALVCGSLLFGDLFNARLCNSLHAMPLRREGWFVTHLVSGLLFSVVPNLVVALCLIPQLGVYWFVSFIWWGGMTMNYLFFFGAAVLAAMCTGSRFAQTLVYGLINFLSILAMWVVQFLYIPLQFGIEIDQMPFVFLSPVSYLCTQELNFVNFLDKITGFYNPNNGWPYLTGVALVGVLMLVGALLIYRRRHLETAGDFITVRFLSPVFLVLYTLAAGTALFLFSYIFDMEQDYLFLAVGIIAGFITGRMLLGRTVRVFKSTTVIGLVVMLAVLFGSMGLLKADAFGIVRWLPEREQVHSVSIRYDYDERAYITADEAEIAALMDVHRELIEEGQPEDARWLTNMELTYTMRDGRTVTRYYPLDYTNPAGLSAARWFSKPEYVLQTDDVAALVEAVTYIELNFYEVDSFGSENLEPVVGADARELMAAIIADCQAGRWSPDWNYHNIYLDEQHIGNIDINVPGTEDVFINLWSGATETVTWLKDHGMIS